MDNGYLKRTKNPKPQQWLAFWAGLSPAQTKPQEKYFKEKSRSLQATGAWPGGVFLLIKKSNVMAI